MKHVIICVAGRSSAGKSTIVRKLVEKYGLNVVQSYTTRAPRESEIKNGLENSDHLFISDEEFDKLENIAAETTINGVRYCTTMDVIRDSDFYVIDPLGITSLRENCGKDFHIVQFYVYAEEEIRKQRFMGRGKTEAEFKQRNDAENSQFSEYENNHGYDILIYNNGDIDYAVDTMDSYVSLILEDRIKEAKEKLENPKKPDIVDEPDSAEDNAEDISAETVETIAEASEELEDATKSDEDALEGFDIGLGHIDEEPLSEPVVTSNDNDDIDDADDADDEVIVVD